MNKKREQDKRQQLRKRNQIHFFQIDWNFVAVITEKRLHHDPAKQHEGNENQVDERQREEFAEPINPVRRRQRIVDLIEANVALAPDKLSRIHGADDEKKQERRSLQNLNH